MSDARIALERGHRRTLEERKALFDWINGAVMYEGGVVTSIPGASPIMIRAPRGSNLQAMLTAIKFGPVRHTGIAMCMVPHATTTVEAGLHSSSPPVRTVTNPGLVECDCLEVSV